MAYIANRGGREWHIIVLNAVPQLRIKVMTKRLWLKHIRVHILYPQQRLDSLLRNLSVKFGREDICKLTTGKESFSGASNDNRVTVTSIPTFRILSTSHSPTLQIL